MVDFSKAPDRMGTDSIKWNFQQGYGAENGLLPFWIADTDFATLPEIMQAIEERCKHPILGYAEYDESVLTAVQQWYERRHGWKIPLDSMFLAGGVVTDIWFTLQAITNPGDPVVVLTPVYDAFFGAIANAGRTQVSVPLQRIENRYEIDFDGLEKAFKDGAKVLVLCSPHNPIARVWTREELARLSGLCKQYGVYILSDEVHGDIALFGNKYVPMGLFEENLDRLIVYTAITKTFNMAGLSSSCMIIPDAELRKKVQGYMCGAWCFGPTSLAFPAIKAAYTHGDSWVDAQNAYIEGNVRFVEEAFARDLPDVMVTKHEGTFLMWVDFNCLGMTSVELSTLMADKYKLALGKGRAYGIEGEGFMRLNVGCTRKTLEEGVSRMAQLYQDVRGAK